MVGRDGIAEWVTSKVESIGRKIGGERVGSWLSAPLQGAVDLLRGPAVEEEPPSVLRTTAASLRSPQAVVRWGMSTKAIAVTYRCNSNCPNCYVRQLVDQYGDITLDNFKRAVDWIASTDTPRVRLMGGEPAVHPRFPELVKIIDRAGLKAVVYTNAMYTERLRDVFVPELMDETWVNLSHITTGEEPHYRRCFENVERLRDNGMRVTLSYVVDDKCPWGEEFLNVAEELEPKAVGLLPAISVEEGLSERYARVLQNLYRMAREGRRRGIPVSIVTPVPLCAMAPGMKEGFMALDPYIFYTRCTIGYGGDYAIRSIINPDLTAFPCPATFIPSPPVTEFKTYPELSNFFRDQVLWFFRNPPIQECQECVHHEALFDTIDEMDPEKFFTKRACNSICLQYHRDTAVAKGVLKPMAFDRRHP